MSSANNKGEGVLPSQQKQGYSQNMMGIPSFNPGLSMQVNPSTTAGNQQQQQHDRLVQLRAQQQRLEAQLKQSHSSNMMQQVHHTRPPPIKIDERPSLESTVNFSSPNALKDPLDVSRLASNSSAVTSVESTKHSTPASVRRESSAQVLAPIAPTDEIKQLISELDWTDRTIYVSRLLMGGASINGFLRATATAQRIKKQRARQIKKQQLSPNEEEDLKKEAMNPRTAKKLRSELVAGLEFCKSLHETLRTVVSELDPSQYIVPLAVPNPVATGAQTATNVQPTTYNATQSNPARDPSPKREITAPPATAQAIGSTSTTTASPGDPNGSTLRRLRKRKFSDVPLPNVSEVDPLTNKKYSKKDYALVLLHVMRFRSLKEGDYVAAKPSSHHLWILARVMKDYPFDYGNPADFLQLSETKRDALFRDKVILKDIEDTNSASIAVARSCVLPLPRTFAEAADWGSRCRKGSRVYAMYPMTTALYSGTVIDNTTYCRGDDDIIVVEFDNEEADLSTGKIPCYHIPARFVTLIPREFPGAAQNTKKRKSATPVAGAASVPSFSSDGSTKAAKRSNSASATGTKHKRGPSTDSALNDMLEEIEYSDIGTNMDLDQFDLEFDLGRDAKK